MRPQRADLNAMGLRRGIETIAFPDQQHQVVSGLVLGAFDHQCPSVAQGHDQEAGLLSDDGAALPVVQTRLATVQLARLQEDRFAVPPGESAGMRRVESQDEPLDLAAVHRPVDPAMGLGVQARQIKAEIGRIGGGLELFVGELARDEVDYERQQAVEIVELDFGRRLAAARNHIALGHHDRAGIDAVVDLVNDQGAETIISHRPIRPVAAAAIERQPRSVAIVELVVEQRSSDRLLDDPARAE